MHLSGQTFWKLVGFSKCGAFPTDSAQVLLPLCLVFLTSVISVNFLSVQNFLDA